MPEGANSHVVLGCKVAPNSFVLKPLMYWSNCKVRVFQQRKLVLLSPN